MMPDDWNISIKWTTAILTILLSILLTVVLKRRRHRRLPPGPFSLPIVGNLLQLKKEPHLRIHEMSKRYGEVFRLYLGQQLVIVISGNRLTSEVLTTRSGVFSMRPDLPIGRYTANGKSFIFSPMSAADHKRIKSLLSLAIKKTEKMFSFNSLKKISSPVHESSSAKPSNATDNEAGIEKLVAHEAVLMGRKLVQLGNEYERKYQHMINGDDKYKKAALKIASIYSCTSMCAIVFGQRYKEHDEPNFIREIFREMESLQTALSILTCFPCLQRVWKKPLNVFIGSHKALQGVVKMHLNARKQATESPTHADTSRNDINRNVTYSIMDNLLQIQNENQQGETWEEETTINMITDTLGAGIDTGAIFSMWLIVYFTVFPVETKQAQAEVDAFVDKNRRMPTYNERNKLPRLMAFITEVIRHSSFVPFTIPHTPAKDTTLNEYEIPRGASILVNLMSLNWDPGVWKDPDSFRPQRFIRKDQLFDKALSEKVNVHGAGRRLCAGVTISRIQMFAVACTLLHTFDYKCLNKKNNVLPKGTMFISITPNDFNVKVCERPDEA